MARAKNQARRSGRSSGTPGWVWLIVGLLMGAAVFGYLQFKDKWGKPTSTLPQPDPQAQARATRGEEVAPDKPKPKYDFYTLLPEKEVVIPDAELDAQARAEAAKPPTPVDAVPPTETAGDPAAPTVASAGDVAPTAPTASSEGPRYLIQAGAFRGSTEAEALKAKIAMTGEIARVEVAQINGNTVHRVRMGPYPNASALAAAKAALANHGITAQAIKVK